MTRDSDDASSRRLREDQVTVDLSLTRCPIRMLDLYRIELKTPRLLSILPDVSFSRLSESSVLEQV